MLALVTSLALLQGTLVGAVPARPPASPPAPASPAGLGALGGRTYSGDFVDVPTRDALLAIGRTAGLSLVLPPGSHGTVTAHFKDVPVGDALGVVLDQAGLVAERRGAIVVVTAGPGGAGGGGSRAAPANAEADEDAEEGAGSRAGGAAPSAKGGAAAPAPDRPKRRGGGHDVDQVGGDVVVEAGQPARDAVAVGGSVTVRAGGEARDAVAILGSVILEPGASVRGAVAVGGDVRVAAGASVERDAVSVGGRVEAGPGATIGGQRTSVPFPVGGHALDLVRSHGVEVHHPLWRVASALARFAVYLAVALFLTLLFPHRVEAVAASMVANPAGSVLAGLLGLVAQPLLLVLLLVTVVGIPLIPVQLFGLAAAGALGFTALAFQLGRSLLPRGQRGGGVLSLAIGVAVLVVGTQIPVLGWIVLAALFLLTFGAVIRTRFGQTPILPTTPVAAAPPP